MLNKNKFYLVALTACLLSAYGCDDDTVSPGSADSNCESDSDCESNHCLDNGKCQQIVGLDDACDDASICRAPLVCTDGVCTNPPAPPATPCGQNEDCNNGQICYGSTCVTPEILEHGAACSASDISKTCNDGLTCYNGTCLTKAEIDELEQCTSDDDCADKEGTVCLSNGECGQWVEAGDACNDKDALCSTGLTCVLNSCVTISKEGEPCDPANLVFCEDNNNLKCVENVCRQTQTGLAKGSDCNTTFLYCATGLTCENQVCAIVHKEGESCNEAEYEVCQDGFACVHGKCTPVSGDCNSSADCTEKDSFCCLDSSCGLMNKCIPYDEETTHDEMCLFKTKPGIFEAQIQCRWQPPADQVSGSKNVEMPPLVGPFGNSAGLKTVVAFYSYSGTAIRFMNPETCETLETISVSLSGRWHNYPAAADLDGDGLMEFITGTGSATYVYKWDPKANNGKGGHVLKINAPVNYQPMALLYDIDNDENTEIVGALGTVIRVKKSDLSFEVLRSSALYKDKNYADGTTSKDGYNNTTGQDVAIGNIDNDPEGIAELITPEGLYTWDKSKKDWSRLLSFDWHTAASSGWVKEFTAYADFGTYDPATGKFDFLKLDGKPEIVLSGKNEISVYAVNKASDGTWSKARIMNVGGFYRGGPVTIGDFNNDGLPEIAIASNGLFGVYDPKCTKYEAGKCADKNVLWERWSQDNSSGTTGSSLFDFDGDGQAEAVYADECFTRVYDGQTGAILFSAKRSSITSIEGPVVADIDDDGSAEILMGSDGIETCANDSGSKVADNNTANNAVDPLHEGIRCIDDEDCPTSKNCNKSIGFCTCSTDDDCNTQYAPGKTTYLKQYVCAEPIDPEVGFMTNPTGAGSRTMAKKLGTRPAGYKTGDYKVCRATRKTTDIGQADLMVFKDRLDRWVSSRNIWNQHAYNIINIEDNGQVPNNAQWYANWLLKSLDLKIDGTSDPRPVYNNYRLNKQGLYGAGKVPDITGRFIPDAVCGINKDGKHVISGQLCNRGTKPVSTKLPATFFYYDEAAKDHQGAKLCTSYTEKIIGVGECDIVGCEVTPEELEKIAGHDLLMVSNLDENGFASTVECNSNNNTDTIHIDSCSSTPIIY